MNIEEATQIIKSAYKLEDGRKLITSHENIMLIARTIQDKRDCDRRLKGFLDENFNFSREET